jgi:hypothetical protein
MKISAPVKYGCLGPILMLGLLVIGGCIYDKFAPSQARKALPTSASEIQEYHHEIGFDFCRCLKAKLPKEDFANYAENLGLKKDYATGQSTSDPVAIQLNDHFPAWFDAPGVNTATTVKYNNGAAWVAVVQYKEPYVYYFIFDW